jgi:hypothetical protein
MKKNIEVIKSIVKDGSTVVAAWGNSIEEKDYLIYCMDDIAKKLNGVNIAWKRLGDLTVKRHPRHPLYLPTNVALNDFDIKGYIK